MALINCPDCKTQISDSAVNCIHCGRPMKLSREAILVELQSLEIRLQQMYDLQDEIVNREEPYDSDSESLRQSWLRVDEINARKSELSAMLK